MTNGDESCLTPILEKRLPWAWPVVEGPPAFPRSQHPGARASRLVWRPIRRAGATGWLAVRNNSMIVQGSASTFSRSSFWSSRNSSIRLLSLASPALSSYRISPGKVVKKPDGNHSLRSLGSVGMGPAAQDNRGSGRLAGHGERVWIWQMPPSSVGFLLHHGMRAHPLMASPQGVRFGWSSRDKTAWPFRPARRCSICRYQGAPSQGWRPEVLLKRS